MAVHYYYYDSISILQGHAFSLHLGLRHVAMMMKQGQANELLGVMMRLLVVELGAAGFLLLVGCFGGTLDF